ncbi:two-component sensor histidine kinase [Actinomyces sp. 2119]|nr:two-component sensor histidine kinase [Actinomyces sp. 2119]
MPDNRPVGPLVDKSIVLGGCTALMLVVGVPGVVRVVWVLVAVVLSSLCVLVEGRRGAVVAPAAYLVAGCLSPESVLGAPLAAYDLARSTTLRAGGTWLLLLCGGPVLAAATGARLPPTAVVLAAVLCAVAVLLGVRTAQGDLTRGHLYRLRDDLQVKVVALERTNARLLEAQDHEVRAAALSERTRIARDIHDTVGHLLTRLTLRVRALQVLHRDHPTLPSQLEEVGATLEEALGSVRRSVHALSEEGEDLPTALNLLGLRCGIKDVAVSCLLDQAPPTDVSHCLLAVTREALTNAVRHGAADSARVALAEYPAFWQVTISNDGAVPGRSARPDPVGMGLRSMRERVEMLGGVLRVTPSPRFTVFATIPKGDA